MDFVNSGLMWFAAGGAIPIIIHLLNRQKSRRVRWAAMEFLLAAIRRTQKRLKLENLILLLIRVCLMGLLALAIARPFFRDLLSSAAPETSTLTLFVIDNSYSMGYKTAQKTLLGRAKKGAEDLLNGAPLSSDDAAAVIAMSDAPELLLQRSNRKEVVREALSNVPLSSFGSSFPATVDLIKDVIDKSDKISKKVYIFTDMQKPVWLADAKELARCDAILKDLCKKAHFSIVDVGDDKPGNYGVVDLHLEEKIVVTGKAARFVAEIANFSDSDIPERSVSLFVNGEKRETVRVPLPAGGVVHVPFDHHFVEAGPYEVRVELDADYLEADDRRFLSIDVKDAIKILCVDGQPAEGDAIGETDFFISSLDPTQAGATFSIEKMVSTLFTAEDMERYDVVVLANVPYLSQEKVERLEKFVKGGGGLLVSLGEKVDKANYQERLFKEGKGLLPASLEKIGGDDRHANAYHLVEADYNHPILSYFREHDLKAALSAMIFFEFYKAKVAEEDKKVRVLARYDDDEYSPALLEKEFGDGKVILLTTTIDSDWNAVVGVSPYLVINNLLVYHLSQKPASDKNVRVGENLQIVLPMSKHAERFSLTIPDKSGGGYVSLTPLLIEKENKFMLAYPAATREDEKEGKKKGKRDGVREAGIYTLTKGDRAKGEAVVSYFSANVNPEEGNLEKASTEEIKKLYPAFRFEKIGEKGESKDDMKIAPKDGDISKYLLYAVVGLLIVESMLAWLFGRSKV